MHPSPAPTRTSVLRARIVATARLPVQIGAIPWRWKAMTVTARKATIAVVHQAVLWPGGRKVVIKVFTDTDRARHTYDRQKRAAFRHPNTVDPLHFSPAGRYFAMPVAPGKPGFAAIKDTSFDAVFEGPVRWLAKTHGTPPAAAKRMIRPVQWFDFPFQHRLVAETPWAEPFHRRWRAFAAKQPARVACTVHGDFHPGNVISNGADFTIIDFDRDGVGSAELELAQFVNQIQLHCVDRGPETVRHQWPHRRDRIFNWYGRPDMGGDPTFACALQYWRICSLRGAASQGNPRIRTARLTHLRDSLSCDPARFESACA